MSKGTAARILRQVSEPMAEFRVVAYADRVELVVANGLVVARGVATSRDDAKATYDLLFAFAASGLGGLS